MIENRKLEKIDPQNPNIPFFAGKYVSEFVIGDKKRKLITYIPADTQASAAGIYLFPPNGVSAEDFLEKSNWIELAETDERKEKMILFVMEAAAGESWNIDEPYGRADGEIEYIHEAFLKSIERDLVCAHESKRYLIGYREGGTIAQMFGMWDPAEFAGLATVDALPVSTEYMAAAANDNCTILNGYEDPDALKGIKKGDVPLPVFLISAEDAQNSAEAKYWRVANGTEDTPRLADRYIYEYYRTKETDYPENQEKECYRVWTMQAENASDSFGYRWNRKIWSDFLYKARRWMADPAGSLRVTEDPVCDLGMEYRYEEVGGWMREWYIHVPDCVKETPERAVPLVFAMHGYSCSGEIYVGNSGWDRVADQHGFIVVFPTATYGQMNSNVPLPAWNILKEPERPYELEFFLYMMDDIFARYNIDKSRVFATGHSHGSLMTQYLALMRPDIFAAVAPSSGILFMARGGEILEHEETLRRPQVDMPIWMFGGEREEWLLDAVPEAGNRTANTIDEWWEKNRMPGKKPIDYSEYKTFGERWNDWTFEKDNKPLIKYTGIDYFPHATMPEMSFRIWNEFFSKMSRGDDGSVQYKE